MHARTPVHSCRQRAHLNNYEINYSFLIQIRLFLPFMDKVINSCTCAGRECFLILFICILAVFLFPSYPFEIFVVGLKTALWVC
jgi:hypothetical protein